MVNRVPVMRLDVLNRMVGSLCASLPVDSIIVFGSRARGDAREDSDVDVYVITHDDGASDLEHMRRARTSLFWMYPPSGYSKDIICSSRSSFEMKSSRIDCVEYSVAREGIVVYE